MTNEYGLEKLQKELLEILIDIDKVCRKNNIKYSLIGGTLLGAVREKGFIPWDDDVDICFTRKEYEKFIRIYPDQKKDSLIITSVFNKCCLTVMSTNKDVLQENKYNIPGPWVTLFVFDNAPKTRLGQKVKVFLVKLIMGMAGKPIHYKDFSRKTKILFSLTALVGKLFSLSQIRKLHNKVSIWGNKKNTGQISIYNSFAGSLKILYPKELIEEYEDAKFEDKKLMVIKKNDIYLSKLYGDYMTPPPEKERGNIHI